MTKIRVERADSALREWAKDGIWRLVQEADEEFIPPLSTRATTLGNAAEDSDESTGPGPVGYYESLMQQDFILAMVGRHIAGFMSYVPNCILEEESNIEGPSLYVTTLIVGKDWRGYGLTRKFYAELLRQAEIIGQPVTTRTWSSNGAHRNILRSMGFRVTATVPDDRGPGIDTLFFVKDL